MAASSDVRSIIKELSIGFCLGTANIIPGVSGGTFLLIFQIYERVFSILGNINKTNIMTVCSLLVRLLFSSGRHQTLNDITAFLHENDFIFLLKLILGALAAIICLSGLMKYLLMFHFSFTYALFFGLILVSVIIPVKMLTHKKAYLAIFAVLGAALTIYVTWAVNPYEKVEKKSLLYQAAFMDLQGNVSQPDAGKSGNESFSGQYTTDEYLYAVACGAVAVSAMVLPGISGSLVLILMGTYFEVVSAISGLASLNPENIAFLGCFAIGIIFGGLFFARLISLVLQRWYNATMAFLIGLMAGSLYALWPFKKSILMARQYIRGEDGQISIVENVRVYTNVNQLPGMDSDLCFSLICFAAGCMIMLFFIKTEQKH